MRKGTLEPKSKKRPKSKAEQSPAETVPRDVTPTWPVWDGYKGSGRRFGLSEWSVRNLVWKGELGVSIVLGRHLIHQGELAGLIEGKRQLLADPAVFKPRFAGKARRG
jgi:hypothetical protein